MDIFKKNIQSVGFENLKKEISEVRLGDRTNFICQKFLPNIAKELDYEVYEKEFLKVDLSFWKPSSKGWWVPKIFIESENTLMSVTDSEMPKLLSLNAPLKVLILYDYNWNEEKFERMTIDTWDFNVKAFELEGQLIGYLGIIIFDLYPKKTKDNIELNFFAYNIEGKIEKSEKLII